MEPQLPEKRLSRLERLELEKKEIERAIKEEQKRRSNERRKWEINQKVRVGAAIISEAQRNPEKMAELLELLDSFYSKDYDRKFFVEWGLSPLHKSHIKPEIKNTPAPPEQFH
jgi:hypothetical protein